MMRTFGVAFGLTAFGLTAFVSSAMAAELPVKAPPPPPAPVWTWTGPYIGAHIGGGWTNRRFEAEDIDQDVRNRFFEPFESRGNASGVVGGGQVGINWQFPGTAWVVGLEGDFSGTDIHRREDVDLIRDGRRLDVNVDVDRRIDWLASFRGRIGYAPWNQVLIYGTGGGAFASARFDVDMFDQNQNRELAQQQDRRTRAGFVVGGGIEWAWGALFGGGYGAGYGGGGWGPFGGCCWTMRIEFLHYQFDRQEREMEFEAPDWWLNRMKKVREEVVVANQDRRFDVNVVRFGINYKFGVPAAPVAARY
jgi:outer membrane immunogenic protein